MHSNIGIQEMVYFPPFYPKLVQINGENLYKFIFTNTQI